MARPYPFRGPARRPRSRRWAGSCRPSSGTRAGWPREWPRVARFGRSRGPPVPPHGGLPLDPESTSDATKGGAANGSREWPRRAASAREPVAGEGQLEPRGALGIGEVVADALDGRPVAGPDDLAMGIIDR